MNSRLACKCTLYNYRAQYVEAHMAHIFILVKFVFVYMCIYIVYAFVFVFVFVNAIKTRFASTCRKTNITLRLLLSILYIFI